MHQTSSWSSLGDRHLCCFCYQLFVSLLAHGPSNHQSGVDIHHGCQVEPSLCCPNSSNVCYPFGVRCISGKISLKQIRCDRIVVLTLRRFHLPSFCLRTDPTLAHQSGYPFSSIELAIVLIRIFDSLS